MTSRYTTFVLSILLAVLLGWLLKIGQAILLPIFASVISIYVLTTAADGLAHLPGLRYTPAFLRRLLVLVIFICFVLYLSGAIALALSGLVERAPEYQTNFAKLTREMMNLLGVEAQPDWQKIRARTIGAIELQPLITSALAYVVSLSGTVFLVVIYASFLMSEQGTFGRKLGAAFPERNQAGHIEKIISDINQRIGDYLTIKTLVNIILAVVSYALLWCFGVEFALLWALLIGLLNYIPYFGSLVGVSCPVLLTLVQFGSLQTTATVACLLVAVQMFIGNVLEPRLIGRQVNLSPFVVLVALSFWTALWGLPGAILAIPLTAMMAIIFAAFPPTRPLAILLAEDVTVYKEERN